MHLAASSEPAEQTTLVDALHIESVASDKVDSSFDKVDNSSVTSSPAKPTITRQDSVTSSSNQDVDTTAAAAAAPASSLDTPLSSETTPLDHREDEEDEMPVSPRLDNDSAIGGSTGVDDNDSLLGSHGRNS